MDDLKDANMTIPEDAPKHLKQSFINDMRHLWPEGVDNVQQHTDVVRIYFMGWISALTCIALRTNSKYLAEEIKKTMEEHIATKDENWKPDISWEWMLKS